MLDQVQNIRLAPGDSFIVNADDAESHGMVYAAVGQTLHVPRGGSLTVGPFAQLMNFHVETLAGSLTVVGPGDPLLSTIARGADRVASARVIASALVEAQQLKEGLKAMGLHDKMKDLAAKMHATPNAMSLMADRLNARLDMVAERGARAEAGMHAVLDDVERGVSATEDALNLLTNGAPEVGESSSA